MTRKLVRSANDKIYVGYTIEQLKVFLGNSIPITDNAGVKGLPLGLCTVKSLNNFQCLEDTPVVPKPLGRQTRPQSREWEPPLHLTTPDD